MNATTATTRLPVACARDFPAAIEPLETRIAPAILYAITNANHLIEFDSATPDTLLHDTPVTGLGAGESVVGMDFRPATSQLYLLTKNAGGVGALYTVNLQTAAATFLIAITADPADVTSPYTTLNGSSFGVDFNPVPDRLRVVSDTGQNLRINPGTGLVITDADLNPGTPTVAAAAYLNSFPGATLTTLYDIDANTDELLIQNPPNSGTLTSVGALGVNTDGTVGFDIGGPNNDAFAALRVGGATQLHRINLDTGAATLVGAIGDGSALAGFAMSPGDLKFKNAKTATFTDEDGDLVTVTVSKGTLERSDFLLRATAKGSLLSGLLLHDDGDEFDQASISITATPHGGDGLVRVGAIESALHDLGTVLVDGDLGRITAGDATTTDAAVKSLTVFSWGRSGLSTQGAGASLSSVLNGPVGSLTVKTDVFEASVTILGGADGTLGKLAIGGSLIGGSAANSGTVLATGAIGSAKIGGDVHGGLGGLSGSVLSSLTLGPVTIGGSLVGDGPNSANIAGATGIGAVKIGRNMQGSQAATAVIHSDNGDIKSVTVGGSIGGLDAFSGLITAFGSIGTITVKGDLAGGFGGNSGQLTAQKLGAVTVLGSVIGGLGQNSGAIISLSSIASVKIGRELLGSNGMASGRVSGTSCGAVSVGLSVVAGSGFQGGSIDINGPLASVTIGGDVRGGSSDNTAFIHAVTSMGPVKVRGSLIGGTGDVSAVISCGKGGGSSPGFMKSVTIGGDVVAGTGFGSGSIGAANGQAGLISGVELGSVTIKGSLIGNGTDSGSVSGNRINSVLIGGDMRGGGSLNSGTIVTFEEVNSIRIAGSLLGGNGIASGQIRIGELGTGKIGRDLIGGAGAAAGGWLVENGGAKSITIGGSVISGIGPQSGSVRVVSLGSLSVGGGVLGTLTTPAELSFSGVAGSTGPVLGKLTVKGSVSFAQILGGYRNGSVTDADANLGSITIGGDLVASSIVAGVVAGGDGMFGTDDDVIGSFGHTAGNVSRITSVIVKGQALGSPGSGDAFGIVAQEIKTIKIGAATYGPLNATNQGPLLLSMSGDFFARTDV
jgi:hypothetical protein